MQKLAKQKRQKEDEGIKDYSKIFSSFYDIFVGNQTDPKNFDLNYAVRDARNMYAAFVNLLDRNAILLNQKYTFDKAPTEFTYKDFGIFPQHILKDMGKNLNDLEEGFRNGQIAPQDKK